MIKVSANYCKSNNNFVILGIKKNNNNVKYIQTIKIVKNILNRGQQVLLSNYLKKYYDYSLVNDDADLKLISNENVNWDFLIKGNENDFSDNPAKDFFNDKLPSDLKEYAFVRNLIIPEIPINEIISEPKEEYKEMAVDFYIPQIKCVIEIDGAQHIKQQYNDSKRDELLKKEKISVLRFNTYEIRNSTSSYNEKMNNLKEKLINSSLIDEYKKCLDIDDNDIEKIELIQIIRLQLAILELLKAGTLNFNKEWNFQLKGIENDTANIAINDLKNWFNIILKLQKIDIEIPNHSINENKENSVTIDIDIYKRYDNTCNEENVVYVRNDYFENNQKNYYLVECDEKYKYDLDETNLEDIKNMESVLYNIFGYEHFREGQIEIIFNLLKLNDTIGILPTGTGKSLCYQLSSLLQPGITFVICPLKSLLKDQKDNINKICITNNARIDSSLNINEKNRILYNLKNAKYQLVLISPERFQNQEFREILTDINEKFSVAYAVIDEVHCMSEWGHDFRISYLWLIKTIKKHIPSSVLVGLTATASDRVLKDLKIEFELENDDNIVTTLNFIRDELEIKVFNCTESSKKAKLYEILNDLISKRDVLKLDGSETKSGIIFTNFAKRERGCISLAKELKNKYSMYRNNIAHFAGSTNQLDSERIKIQDKFKNDELSLLVATKAFGMGIDKGNIRYIIHYGIPSSIESLYQEIGRAGRDRKKSVCYIIHAEPEKDVHEFNDMFKATADYYEITDVLKQNTWGTGDIFDLMNLHMYGKSEDEVSEIYDLYQKYIENKDEFELSFDENDANKIENSVYKLGLIGVVEDWTIEYGVNSRKIKGESVKLSDKEIEKNIEQYINKYEYDFSFKNIDHVKYKFVDEILKKDCDKLKKYINILCTWYDENILYSSRRGIEQVDKLISSMPNENYCTDEFNDKIYNYFRPEDYNLLLKYISKNNNFIEVIKTLYNKENKIETSRVDTIRSALDRLLITNRLNPMLDLLSGIVNLIQDKKDDTHIEEFDNSLRIINESEERNIIYEEILLVFKDLPKEAKNRLNQKIFKYFNTLNDFILNYKILKTDDAAENIIKLEKTKLLDIERGVINGF